MNTTRQSVDLTTADSALAYLRSLSPETSVSLPSGGEHASAVADAVSAISGEHASVWARSWNRWDWTAGELVSALTSSTQGTTMSEGQ